MDLAGKKQKREKKREVRVRRSAQIWKGAAKARQSCGAGSVFMTITHSIILSLRNDSKSQMDHLLMVMKVLVLMSISSSTPENSSCTHLSIHM